MTSLLDVISLGAGVQSTAMALMAAHGDTAQPDLWAGECEGMCGV